VEDEDMAKKQELTKDLAMKIAKAGKIAAKELGALPTRKPHK
jgi:hypothetical protein